MEVYITEYYKRKWAQALNNFTLIEEYNHDIPQSTPNENEILMADFSVEEVYEAIAQIKLNKVTGLDGFSAKFY